MTTATAEITITPAMMAQAFWKMTSTEQVEFFKELSIAINEDHDGGNTSAFCQGEMQWHYVGRDLLQNENEEARSMLMTMAAPLYLNTLTFEGGEV